MSVDRIEVTEDTTSSLYGNYAMGGVINIVTSRPTRRTIEIKPQYGNQNSPKFDFFASDRWNKVGVAVEGSFFNTDGFPIVATERARADRQQRQRRRTGTSAASSSTPRPTASRTSSAAALLHRGSQQRQGRRAERHASGRPSAAASGRGCRTTATSRRACSSTSQTSHFNFLAVTNAATTRNVVRLATDQHVPTNGVGGMVQWSKVVRHVATSSAPAPTGAGSTATARKMPTSPARPDRPGADGVTQPATLSVQRVSGGTQQSLGAFVQDIFTPIAEAGADAQRARRSLEELRRPQSRDDGRRPACRPANNRRRFPDETDTVVSPRVAALYHLTDRVTRLGRVQLRIPRADAHRAVPPVLGGRGDDASERSARAGAPDRRRSSASMSRRREPHRPRSPGSTTASTNPVSNVTLDRRRTAQKQNLGATRIWGVQTDVEYRARLVTGESRRRISTTRRRSPMAASRMRRWSGKYLRAGADAPRLAAGGLRESEVSRTSSLGVQFIGRAVQRRSERQLHPGRDAEPTAGYDPAHVACGLPGYARVDFTSRRATSAEPPGVLRRAEPVRPGLLRPDESRRRSARRGWSTAACGVARGSGRVVRLRSRGRAQGS